MSDGEEGSEEVAASEEDKGYLSGSIGTIGKGLIGASSGVMLERLPDESCGDEMRKSRIPILWVRQGGELPPCC